MNLYPLTVYKNNYVVLDETNLKNKIMMNLHDLVLKFHGFGSVITLFPLYS